MSASSTEFDERPIPHASVIADPGSATRAAERDRSALLAPSQTANSLTLTILCVIAVAFTLYMAASLFIPIAVATLLSMLLSPTVRALARWRIPPALSAAVIVGGMLFATLTTITLLSDPARIWLQDVPETLEQLRLRMDRAESPLTDIEAVAREVDDLTAMDGPNSDASEIEIRSPGLYESAMGELPSLLAALGVVVFLTFFLLASGDTLLRKVTRFGTTFVVRRRIVTVAYRIQADISRYLGTVTIVNIGLGLCTAALMHWLAVPNPLLWGVMAGMLNFAPYLGAAASTTVLLLVGVSTFETRSTALLVPLSFLLLTVLEGQLITPAVIGKRLALSPTAVFVAVVVWGWLWGVAGALMAVPIVASIKVICENVAPLRPLADLLGE